MLALISTAVLLLVPAASTKDVYKFETKPMTWLDAEQACQKWGGHLVTITTKEQNAYLSSELKKRNIDRAWIGFNDRLKEGSFQWTNPLASAGYTNWGTTEPNGKTAENCGELMGDGFPSDKWKGYWNDISCDNKWKSICQKPPDGPYQYKFETKEMTWLDAENECQRWGGHLVTITTKEQNAYLSSELKKRNMVRAWIGINDRVKEGSFQWSNILKTSLYTSWAPKEPNGKTSENCGELIGDGHPSDVYKGHWNDLSCNRKWKSICQKPADVRLQYRFEKKEMTWVDAENQCAEWGGHLATIISAEQNKQLADELKKRNIDSAWIGFNDRLNDGTFRWFDSSISTGYTNWRPTEPNGKVSENCAELIPGIKYNIDWKGTWNDSPCQIKKASICQKPTEVPLQYKFEKTVMTWENAEKECQKWGGHLATITSKEKNDQLTKELNIRNMGSSWIGFNDRLKEGTYQWVDPSNSAGYTNWRTSEPNGKDKENCAEILAKYQGTWNDMPCQWQLTSICQKPRDVPVQYHFLTKALTWVSAELECQKWGGHLATITSKEQNDYLTEEMNKRKMVSGGWIGLNDQLKENTFQWIHPLYANDFTNWNKAEPNGKTKENCVELVPNVHWKGKWNDLACLSKRPAVCQKPGDVPLQYKFESKSLSWMDAEKDCQNWGGHLITITSAAQNAYFANGLKMRNMPSAWIGYNDQLREGSFQWINPLQSKGFTNWHKDEPNGGKVENCVELITDKKYSKTNWNATWNDRSCDIKSPYICQKPAETVTTGSICRRDFRKIGCFLRDWSKVPHLLVTDLDSTHKNYTTDMNWDNYSEGLHSIACRCRAIAVGHYKYFAIGFHGECVSGNDYAALEKMFAMQKGVKEPKEGCINGNWDTCDKNHHAECAGAGDYDFFYEVIN